MQDADFLYLTGLLQQGVALIESMSSSSQGKFSLFLPTPTPAVRARDTRSGESIVLMPSTCNNSSSQSSQSTVDDWIHHVVKWSAQQAAGLSDRLALLYCQGQGLILTCQACYMLTARDFWLQEAVWDGDRVSCDAAMMHFGADAAYPISEVSLGSCDAVAKLYGA